MFLGEINPEFAIFKSMGLDDQFSGTPSTMRRERKVEQDIKLKIIFPARIKKGFFSGFAELRLGSTRG